MQLLKFSRKKQPFSKLQLRNLSLEIFLAISLGLWVFETHFLIKTFVIYKKKNNKPNKKNPVNFEHKLSIHLISPSLADSLMLPVPGMKKSGLKVAFAFTVNILYLIAWTVYSISTTIFIIFKTPVCEWLRKVWHFKDALSIFPSVSSKFVVLY